MAKAASFSSVELESPVGPLLVAATPKSVIAVVFSGHDWDLALDQLESRFGEPTDTPSALLEKTALQLDEYFAGLRTKFTVKVDFGQVTDFRRSVLEQIAVIPFGQTSSYAEIAAAAGKPKAVRAAGTSTGSNPVPILVPCHRVIRADGAIGKFSGGVGVKERLLAHESSV